MQLRHVSSLLILASALNLALMVPGGFVETRAFPDYPVWIIAGFNIFLTVLGLGALILALPLWRTGKPRTVAIAAAASFVAVYAADLAEVFPVSSTPMPPLLTALEWIGAALGLLALVALARLSPSGDAAPMPGTMLRRLFWPLVALATLIVVFDTRAAIA